MTVLRAFIAVDLSPEILAKLERITTDLRREIGDEAVRWVPSENIHLTLKFLGDVSLNNLTLLTDALRAEVAGHKRFGMSVGGLGAFPKASNARVIWVGVEAPDALVHIQRGLESQMARLGYEPEGRPFTAHLTLGRVSRNAHLEDIRKIGAVLGRVKVGFLGMTPVQAVHLYRSDLRPGGSIYTRIFTAPLAN
jgi:2'-5' RNA ligase